MAMTTAVSTNGPWLKVWPLISTRLAIPKLPRTGNKKIRPAKIESTPMRVMRSGLRFMSPFKVIVSKLVELPLDYDMDLEQGVSLILPAPTTYYFSIHPSIRMPDRLVYDSSVIPYSGYPVDQI
jgi:hypothetical protein